jgi:hypothetical protein
MSFWELQVDTEYLNNEIQIYQYKIILESILKLALQFNLNY